MDNVNQNVKRNLPGKTKKQTLVTHVTKLVLNVMVQIMMIVLIVKKDTI